MTLSIRDDNVNRLAEKLAAKLRINKTEAVRFALTEALEQIERAKPLRERLAPIQQRVLARPATGLDADKTFFDSLSGDA
jgi:antitoxin VapB